MLELLIFVPGALFTGFLMGRVARVNRPPKHTHTWISRSVYKQTLYANDLATRPTRRYTTVLQTCFCSESRTTEVDGHWELQDLT